MKHQIQLPKTIKIGDSELDVPSGIVADGDRSTRLDPKSVDVALFFAEHPDQLVTHDQLLEAVWPNKVITESQLSKRITEIRRALGDNQKPYRYIETLPKRGYRLVCQCEIVEASMANMQNIESATNLTANEIDQASPPPARQSAVIANSLMAGNASDSALHTDENRARQQWRSSRSVARAAAARPFLSTAIAMLVIALGYLVYTSHFAEETLPEELQVAAANGTITVKSVAVLPFVDLSPDQSEQWYSDGLTEEIINSLARLPELRVSARTSSFRFRGENLVIPDIAVRLAVANIVEGSVRRDGDRLRISVQLIRADDGFHMWSESYDESTEAIFDVQKDVAESIASTLDIFLDDERRELMFQIGTRNVEAYEAYLQGMGIHDGDDRRDTNLWDANVFFARTLELDPDFAAAALMHSDAFIHVMMKGNNTFGIRGDNNPLHSAEAAQDLLMADLDRAAANARNPSLKLGIELQREFFSPNWQRIPGLISRLREQIDSYPWSQTDDGWLVPILNFFGEHEMSRVLAEARLSEDPLDTRGLEFLIAVERYSGNFDVALELSRTADLINGGHERTVINRGMAIYGGDREKAMHFAETDLELHREGGGGWYNFWKAYLAAVRGDYGEATRFAVQWEASRPFDGGMAPGLLLLYNETGDESRSRAITEKIDAMPGGSAILARTMKKIGNSLPFNLADAPNFTAQLRQAGIDPHSLKQLPRLSTIDEKP